MRIEACIVAWGVAIAITILQVTVLGSAGPLWILGLAAVQSVLIALFFLGLIDEPRSISALLAVALSTVSAFIIAILV